MTRYCVGHRYVILGDTWTCGCGATGQCPPHPHHVPERSSDVSWTQAPYNELTVSSERVIGVAIIDGEVTGVPHPDPNWDGTFDHYSEKETR